MRINLTLVAPSYMSTRAWLRFIVETAVQVQTSCFFYYVRIKYKIQRTQQDIVVGMFSGYFKQKEVYAMHTYKQFVTLVINVNIKL